MKYLPIVIVCVVAITLEVLFFNFAYFRAMINNDTVYMDESNLLFINWELIDNSHISLPDPQIIWLDVERNVRSFTVEYYPDTPASGIEIFFTNYENPLFSDEAMISVPEVAHGSFTVVLNQHINDLRVDLVENAGFEIENVMITVNPAVMDFSFSRVIAIVLIFIGSKFLFSLQKIPSYTEKVTL